MILKALRAMKKLVRAGADKGNPNVEEKEDIDAHDRIDEVPNSPCLRLGLV